MSAAKRPADAAIGKREIYSPIGPNTAETRDNITDSIASIKADFILMLSFLISVLILTPKHNFTLYYTTLYWFCKEKLKNILFLFFKI
jgi:hypothetical protein